MIIEQLKESGLKGRGGAGFPTGLKWEAVKNAPGDTKYVVCNVSEGEPAVAKDGWLLEHAAQTVIDGVALAMVTVAAARGYLYLRKDYYDKFKTKLQKLVEGKNIELFREPCGYLGGEETTLLEVIEGHRAEPRLKPPYPTTSGLFGCPTIINNCETFYSAAKIAAGEYKQTRFYTLFGVKKPGVYELPESLTMEQVLRETGNYPAFDFFVQAGGGASGAIMTKEELGVVTPGAGSIVVHDEKKTDPRALMKKWARFFIDENCGKCVPCREGVYRLNEILARPKFDEPGTRDIVALLKDASYCPFGKGVANAFETLLDKIWTKTTKKQ